MAWSGDQMDLTLPGPFLARLAYFPKVFGVCKEPSATFLVFDTSEFWSSDFRNGSAFYVSATDEVDVA